ncbi:S-adenosyl-L-methionine-dependent methyltransferase [Amylocystis lapponica]|nr:S-adenosyl-L-methionine-dependent methyltransferase [Amylocystis lapponica]
MSDITIDNPASIAAINPYKGDTGFKIILAQIEERVQLVKAWDIQPGERVLEIGCGQGECTATLAAAVGANGSVTGLDPARLDYGSPYTLGEAQAHLLASPLGARMAFVQSDPLAFLAHTTATYTTAVFAQSIWYFAQPGVFASYLRALAPRVDRICIAEWALRASEPRAVAHVLATVAEAALECRKPESESNIRTVLSPEALRAAAAEAGLKLGKEEYVVPGEGMRDGTWESSAVLSTDFAREIEEYVVDEKEKSSIYATRDSVRAAVDLVKGAGKQVRAMDVWVATYIKG